MSTPFTPNSVFEWQRGHHLHTGRIIAAMPFVGAWRVILMDTAESHWVGDINADGALTVHGGPVTGAEALDAAQRVLCGIRDRGSVSGTAHTLAVALVAQIAASEEAGP